MNNHATDTEPNHCPECAMAHGAAIEAHQDHAYAWRQYRAASNAFFTDTANGLLLLGSHACEQRWHEVEQLWREAQTCYEAWMDAHRVHIHTVCAHHQLQKAAEMDEDPITGDGVPCACAMCATLDKDVDDTDPDTKPTPAERATYFEARDHADDTDTPDAPRRRTAVRIVAYDAHKDGCHEVDPTDVPVWLLDTPNTAIARITRQATLQEIRTLIDDLIDEPDERGKGES